MSKGGGGGVDGNQFPTVDAESKFAKIQNSHVQAGGGGEVLVETNFQKSTSNFRSPVLS